MKVVLFGLNGRGGMLHYTSQYANALAKKAEVYVILPSYADTSLFSKKVHLKKITAPPSMLGTILQTIQFKQHTNLLRWIHALDPDVVHVMDNHPWYLYYVKSLHSKRLYATIHDPETHSGEYSWLRQKIIVSVTRTLCRFADAVFVHGKAQEKTLKKNYEVTRVVSIPHGEYSFFTQYKGKSLPKKGKHLLFFGRIFPYKGIDILLQAFQQLLAYDSSFYLTIAGQGDMEPYNKFIAPTMKKRITLLNAYVSNVKVAQLFRQTDAVVLPYKDASQTGIIPVAYSFKKPVIASNVGSIPDVVVEEETGLLVEPNNVNKLYDAIVRLFSEDYKQMGLNAYNFLNKHLSWDTIAKTAIGVYAKK